MRYFSLIAALTLSGCCLSPSWRNCSFARTDSGRLCIMVKRANYLDPEPSPFKELVKIPCDSNNCGKDPK